MIVLGYKLLIFGKIGCIKEANIPGYRPRYSGALYNCAGIIAGDAIIQGGGQLSMCLTAGDMLPISPRLVIMKGKQLKIQEWQA